MFSEKIQSTISRLVNNYMHCKVLDINLLGSGANGEVYWCKLDNEPLEIAVKVTNYSES